MQQLWSGEELVERWSLAPVELALLPGKADGGKLGFAIQLAFYKEHASFPDDEADIAPAVIAHIAGLIGVPTAMLDEYEVKRHLATPTDKLPWLFISERGQPLTRQSVNYLVAGAAAHAGLPPVWPHMLRHSFGFYLANRGHDLRLIQDYLGHRDPKHTVHYTRTAAGRFEGLWR